MLPDEPAFEERIQVMRRHLDLMVEVFGESKGCMMFRKVAPWYTKRFGPVNQFNKRVVMLETRDEFESILTDYLDWREQFLGNDGQLKPQYRPQSMQPSFMDDQPAVAKRKHIPVPKGPVEVW